MHRPVKARHGGRIRATGERAPPREGRGSRARSRRRCPTPRGSHTWSTRQWASRSCSQARRAPVRIARVVVCRRAGRTRPGVARAYSSITVRRWQSVIEPLDRADPPADVQPVADGRRRAARPGSSARHPRPALRRTANLPSPSLKNRGVRSSAQSRSRARASCRRSGRIRGRRQAPGRRQRPRRPPPLHRPAAHRSRARNPGIPPATSGETPGLAGAAPRPEAPAELRRWAQGQDGAHTRIRYT